MAEREEGGGIEDSVWVVGKDGITFHEHEDMNAALAEELELNAAYRRFIDGFAGPSLEDMLEEVARDYDKGFL